MYTTSLPFPSFLKPILHKSLQACLTMPTIMSKKYLAEGPLLCCSQNFFLLEKPGDNLFSSSVNSARKTTTTKLEFQHLTSLGQALTFCLPGAATCLSQLMILLGNDLPGSFPIRQVCKLKVLLPSKKNYLSQTTRQDLVLSPSGQSE